MFSDVSDFVNSKSSRLGRWLEEEKSVYKCEGLSSDMERLHKNCVWLQSGYLSVADGAGQEAGQPA